MRTSHVIAALCAWLLCLQGALAAEPLRVGITTDYPPLTSLVDGDIVGIEADNAREVAAFLDRPLKLVPLGFEQLFPALLDGKVDVLMAGVSVTPERQTTMDFATPFMEVGQMAVVLSANIARFAAPRALYQPGVRIGVEPGTSGDRLVQSQMSGAERRYYADSMAAFTGLREGAIDAYIHDAPTSWALANSREDQDLFSLYRPLTNESLAWAVRKGNAKLLNELNAARDELERNGRLSAIQNYWIPVRVNVR